VNVSLGRGLGTKLVQIVVEEQGRVQLPPRSTGPNRADRFSAEDLNWQKEQARQCRERILERARTVLDERQHQRFTEFMERKLAEALEQIQRFNLQDVRPFFRWLVDFYFLLALPLYCLSVCGSMMRDELQADTLGFLTTRPVTRAQLFLVKYLCQITWLQALAAVQALLLFAAGLARGAPGAASAMALFFGAQFLAVLAWGALSALLGLVTRRYILLGILYGFVVEIGLGRIPTNINTLSLTRHLQGLLGHNVLLNQLYEWAPQSGWVSVGALLLATVLFLGAGAALFTFREYHHVTEMQK
jgi:ABC-type transport system involved in multi-copper enzyme maturation permease subunit